MEQGYIISVASYNTSWLSDLGLPNNYASEKNFLHQLFSDENETDKRKYIKNAINNSIDYWKNIKSNNEYPVIGFQEMNNRDSVQKIFDKKGYQQEYEGGSKYIVEQFKAFIGDDMFYYKEHFVTVQDPDIVPGLLTIWDKELGVCIHEYGADLNFEISTNMSQKGRPIMILFTESKNIFINLHGPNFPSESSNNMQFLRDNIQMHLDKAFEQLKNKNTELVIDKNEYNIFIMGDFNDPYNSINPNKPLILNGKEYSYGNIGDKAPKSCCYNFNSSCPIDLYIDKDLTDEEIAKMKEISGFNAELGDEPVINKGDCFIIQNKVNRSRNQGPKISDVEARSLGDRGKIENYRFTGDYVLGPMDNIKQSLQIYNNSGKEDYSTKSDHEMVYAKFEINTKLTGGNIKHMNKKVKLNKTNKTNKTNKLNKLNKLNKNMTKLYMHNKRSNKNRKSQYLNKNKTRVKRHKTNRNRRGGGMESSISLFGIPLVSQTNNTIRYDPTTGESKPITKYSIFGFELPYQK